MKTYIEVGMPIKLEVDVVPPYLSFWGVIEEVQDNELVVKIEGQYAQGDIRKVKCTIPKDTKACIFETFILQGKGEEVLLKLPPIKQPELVQRRKYVRVSTDLPVNCFLIGFNDQKIESQKSFPAAVKDLSGGGVLINSSLSLPVGTVIVFELELNNQKMVLTAKVLRNTENMENNTRDLGCEFIGLDDSDRQRITAYCTRMQLMNKRR
ncbi:flagellar brake protein [Alkaliphilus transvaalensis]|uniref:flagellar brake protein n=1 Tax=Alkaliphilus transvaalensis TaxID=114628 RepID=UPI00047E5D08|nr:PilZ domain-containing protein [Alkaliphilus transvaalensis]